MATEPLLFSEVIWLPVIPTYAVVIFFPERRSARSSAAAMEVTVSSIFTTTPRRKPCEGQVPTPTIFSFPSRSSSPTSAQIFVVPTSIPTITRSCTIHAPIGRYKCETHYGYLHHFVFPTRTITTCSTLQRIHRTQTIAQVNSRNIQLLLLRQRENLLEFNEPVV